MSLASPGAAGTCAQPAAEVVSAQGSVQILRAGSPDEPAHWGVARLRDTCCPGDSVRVRRRGRADLLLANGTLVRLDQETTVRFTGPAPERSSVLELLLGALYFITRTPRTFEVHTRFVNAGVEGTEFYIRADADGAFLTVFEGKVVAANEAGRLTVGAGQSVTAGKGVAPALKLVARPRDAVQWTLYYPPVFPSPAGVPGENAAEGWEARASGLLAAGRVDEARGLIDEALGRDPGNGAALALGSVVAVAQNDRENALALGRKAVAASPGLAAGRIALSYAQQASFDLEGARASVEEAVAREPGNALARARLAELRMSFGDLDGALEAAREAGALSDNLARTQAVLGFVLLAQVKTQGSREAFERAIALDSADPLPRLGLGLAMIREGDLSGGRREIEIAASLDTTSSLVRSYLGKAYYEEKRDALAASQLSMAKEFDPSDPTPWFYDAIRKQSGNRPVEALKDLQKSVDLNDHRAVYRSRLLLDEDLAARSASLGRIYDDLGFQQLALAEGWKSVAADPANFSAHRFLADSYAALPRHEIARVSELLQAQLLQPININPLQPHLAQSDLLILQNAGPSGLSFNEFNPAFNRNRWALQAGGIGGSHRTVGDEIVLSGLRDRVSFSLGQFHYETDGFRENNDLKQDIHNVFTQVSLSHDTSVQAEFRSAKRDNGDLTLRFDPNDFSRSERQDATHRSARLGIRRSFSPGSHLIASAVYEDAELVDRVTDFPPDIPGSTVRIENVSSDRTYSFEFQYLRSMERLGIVGGAGFIRTRREDALDTEFAFPPEFGLPPDITSETTASRNRHVNLYLYSQVRYPGNVTWTVGGSADFLRDTKDAVRDRSRLSPKLGVIWTPVPGTAVRAAAFRAQRRTLVATKQTIEPTQIAGFNQFFDDVGGTDSWRYGIGVDRRFSENVYGGVEHTQRDLKVPIGVTDVNTGSTEERILERRERLGRAYLYWTPHPRIGLNAEYRYEREDNENLLLTRVIFVKTRRFPLGAGYFHPRGWIARAKATHVRQDTDPGSDSFWVVDGSIGYRLPGRWGLASIEAKNLFNREFRFQDPDPANPSIQPGRAVFFRFTLAL